MIITVNSKEYWIKYGVEVTAKSQLLSKMIKNDSKELTLENMEQIALTIAEVLLIGLQNKHSDEFGYDLDTEEGKTEALSKVCELIDDYTDIEGNDIFELYGKCQEELGKNGFIKSLMQKAQAQAEAEAQIEKPEIKKTTRNKKK